ncbi:unnamed protein product [Tenebrio molitor]|nr:unnamed protein product [Tenebrio molitor]
MKKITTIREGLNEMIKIVKQKTNFKEGDLMNIVVNHPDLFSPISTGLSRTSDIDNLLNKIQSILTSNQDLDIYGCTFYAEVCTVSLIIVKNVINHIKIKTDINAKRRIKYLWRSLITKKTVQKEYIVKNVIDIVLIKNVLKIIQKFVKDFINA